MKALSYQPPHRRAFSLIEVVIALSVISFGLIATLGLLPVGLGAQRQAVNQARGLQSLTEISRAVRDIYVNTNGTTSFPQPLQNLTPGQAGETSFSILANGQITESSTGEVRARGYIRQYPTTANGVIPIYISIAWPSAATRTASGWSNYQGSVESFTFTGSP